MVENERKRYMAARKTNFKPDLHMDVYLAVYIELWAKYNRAMKDSERAFGDARDFKKMINELQLNRNALITDFEV